MARIGLYGRKSIYSDKSESVEHQFKLGEDYARAHYENFIIVKYEDEGVGGSDLNRPGFQRLLEDIKNGLLDVVICYKLDRISRDVADFAAMYKVFVAYGVELIPLRDNLVINDTMTPIEKAMMYMNSIFSQVERENTVIRITDNMLELAKSGYWPGGKAPIGFHLRRITENGKKHTILCENTEEMEFLNMVADTLLTGYTLSGLETHFRKIGVKTIKGCYLSGSQIWNMLKTPFHAPADAATYDYFKSLGCIMVRDRSEYDGTHGILVYGRTAGSRKRKHVVNSPDKWVVSIGKHSPTMTSDKWLSIQRRFGLNTIDRTRKHEIGILKGIMRCKCGYAMRVQHKVDKVYDKIYDNYYCQNRNRRGKDFCNVSMVRVDAIDSTIINILKEIKLDRSLIDKYIAPPDFSPYYRTAESVQREINATQKKIKNLTANLSEASGSTASRYIIMDIEEHDRQLSLLNIELREIKLEEQRQQAFCVSKEEKYAAVCHIVDSLETASYAELNTLLKGLLLECVYDGETLHLKI